MLILTFAWKKAGSARGATLLDSFYSNIDRYFNYTHNKTVNPSDIDFHLHDRFEIYFFISGNVNYLIEKKVYSLEYGDLLVINSHEIHKPSFLTGNTYERIVVHFDPSIPRLLSPPDFNLLNCFTNRPKGSNNRLSLNKDQLNGLFEIFIKMERLENDCKKSTVILKLICFLELLVFINNAFSSSQQSDIHLKLPQKLVPILDYIDENLHNELSLGTLEREFYIDRFHLSRLFKKSIGSSIYEYIIMKRISKAKTLLAEGHNVTYTAGMCGFNDYSNFLRMFKRIVGMPPGQYKKRHSVSGGRG